MADESILHTLDPRLKVGILTGVSIIMPFARWQGLLLTTLVTILLIFLSRTSWKSYRNIVLVLLPLSLFYIIGAGWVWDNPWQFWQGHWSKEGIELALILIWRISVIFVLTYLFISITPPLEQGLGIAYFFNPFTKVTSKAADFALLISLTLRFIPMIKEESALLWKAWTVQGNTPEKGIKGIINLVKLLPSLLLMTLQRAEEVGENMQLRGYGCGKYQVLMFKEWTKKDSCALAIAVLFAILQLLFIIFA